MSETERKKGERVKRPEVVIIGGGFAGISAAKVLEDKPVNVTILDRTNHNLFQPLLYQVATSGLGATDIAKPIRSVLRDAGNVDTFMDEVVTIDRNAKVVHGKELSYPYDYLILATGTRHSYFGHDEWEQHAPGLKSLDDALENRRRILSAFEKAEKTHDEEERRKQLTFVIVGGGPTGVEMAGAIAELSHTSLARDFRHINPKNTRIILAEAGPMLLPAFGEKLAARAKRDLEKLGVEVHLEQAVVGVDADGVDLKDKRIPTATVIWAAGNAASPLGKQIGARTDRQGRVLTEKDLSVKSHPEIFVVGDLADFKQENGQSVPGVAQGALQMGRHAAENILRVIEGKPTVPFRYFDKGNLATIGRNSAVADIHIAQFGGLLAFLTWAFIHLFFLVGFRNRVVVFVQWIFAYFTFTRGARIITREEPHPANPATMKLKETTAGRPEQA